MRLTRGAICALTLLALLQAAPDASAAPRVPVAGAATAVPQSLTLPDRLIGVGDARQLVVVTGSRSSSWATLTAYSKTSAGWRPVSGLWNLTARVGANGFVPATSRVQGTGTTPEGSFALGPAFGVGSSPGTRMPYRRVQPSDRWAYDRTDPSTYNTYQPSGNWDNQERLYYVPNRQYRYVAVIGFNRPTMSMSPTARPVSRVTGAGLLRGGGIFLHVTKYVDGRSRPTAGCVSVDEAKMRTLLQWLDPAKSPRIIMGPSSVITRSASVARASALSPLTTTRIGTSREGRAIVAVRRGPSRPARTLVIVGSIHGNERYGHRVVSALRTATLPSGLAVVLIPTMNPDGVAAVQRTNARGVDINRNFPTAWKAQGAGTSRWSGPSAASEPETRAVRDYLDRLNPSMVVIFHSALDGVDLYGAKSPATVRALARATGFRAASFDCNGGCHGTLTQWFNRTQAGQAITFEFGESPSSAVIDAVARGVLRVAATVSAAGVTPQATA